MASSEIKLRAYRPSDFDTLLKIDQACFPKGIAYGKFEMRIYLTSPGSFCLVAEMGAEIAGFIVVECSGRTAHIITIDVPQTHRRQGVGALLLAAAEGRAADEGVRRVDLESATTNHPAIAFWRKHGYRDSGMIRNYYGRGADAFEMQKTLGLKSEGKVVR